MRFEELLQDSRAEGKAEGKVEGRVAGKRESVVELLTENGEVPKELRTLIESQTDTEILSRWLRLAAKSGSVEEFVSNM